MPPTCLGYRCTCCALLVAPRVPNETRAGRDRMRKRQLCPGCYYALFPCDHCVEAGPCLRCQVMFTRRQWRDNARYRAEAEQARVAANTESREKLRRWRQRKAPRNLDAARELA